MTAAEPVAAAAGRRIDRVIDIVNLSNLQPSWLWLNRPISESVQLRWFNRTRFEISVPQWLPKSDSISSLAAAGRAAQMLSGDASVLVSHGPRLTFYGAICSSVLRKTAPHLAFSFNFTDLPNGVLRKSMARAYRLIDRFVVFSSMERKLYSEYFDLPIDRFDMIHWGVRPPEIFQEEAIEQGPYICAIGSQGRDYEVLLRAIRILPAMKFVIVTTPNNLCGLAIPENARVLTNISLRVAMNILNNASLMVLPLRSSQTPCGHVTIVSAMHLGKPILATDSVGVRDYIEQDVTGRVVTPRDPVALSNQIEELLSSPADLKRLGECARTFASHNCSEDNTANYLGIYIDSKFNNYS